MHGSSLFTENDFGKPVKIFLNNEQVKTPEKGYDKGGQIANTQIDFEFPVYFETKKGNKTVDHEEWVSGSIWVNNVGGQVDAGGFNVYRKGQLVQRHDNTIFRVLAENARVEGELHLDFVPANQRKTYFNEKDPGFKEVERFLKHLFQTRQFIRQHLIEQFLQTQYFKQLDCR